MNRNWWLGGSVTQLSILFFFIALFFLSITKIENVSFHHEVQSHISSVVFSAFRDESLVMCLYFLVSLNVVTRGRTMSWLGLEFLPSSILPVLQLTSDPWAPETFSSGINESWIILCVTGGVFQINVKCMFASILTTRWQQIHFSQRGSSKPCWERGLTWGTAWGKNVLLFFCLVVFEDNTWIIP